MGIIGPYNPDATGNNWAIAVVGTGGASTFILGGSIVYLQLANTDTGYSWSYWFIGAGLSAGFKFGLTLSNPSWSQFTVVGNPIDQNDFNSFGSFKGAEFTPLVGGSLTWANIYSVNHNPNPLDLGGVQIGISGGFDWTPGRFILIESSSTPMEDVSMDTDQIYGVGANYIASNAPGGWVS